MDTPEYIVVSTIGVPSESTEGGVTSASSASGEGEGVGTIEI